MKKETRRILVCGLALWQAAALYALPRSAGGGNAAGLEIKTYLWDRVALSGAFIDTGYFGFVDWQYLEVALEISAGFGLLDYFTGAKININAAVLGKYPFKTRGSGRAGSRAESVYPFAGINGGYDLSLGLMLNVIAGAGWDRPLTERLFLRTEVFYAGTVLSEVFLKDRAFADRYGFGYLSANNGVFARVGIGCRL
ncbi:MAG: hypothetical protein LBR16_07255 [Treponema sp.]|jgi:hypothetical protein|nr:hypothetical protein [Treponema sp.]